MLYLSRIFQLFVAFSLSVASGSNISIEIKDRLTLVGAGYVGLVSGACFSELGVDVSCVDNDEKKIENLRSGIVPIHEPGLNVLISNGVLAKRLRFTTDLSDAVLKSNVVMIAVGTPSRKDDGHADLSYVYKAVEQIAKNIKGYTVVVTKSTVPVGTGRKIAKIISEVRLDLVEGEDFDVASNPEFLREGSAIGDFMKPDRVVIGIESERAQKILNRLYSPLSLMKIPIVFTNLETAELIKYASNSFLAMKVTFINQMSDLCEKSGARVQDLAEGVGLDSRIGPKFLNVGPGYGGSCFPKDTLALKQTAYDLGTPCSLVNATIDYNDARKKEMGCRIIQILNENTALTKEVALLGITFKSNTDDLRDASSLSILSVLKGKGVNVRVYDPLYHAKSESLSRLKEFGDVFEGVGWAASPYEAIKDSSAVVVLTEWDEFKDLKLELVASLLNKTSGSKPIFIDYRNMYAVSEMGLFTYYSLGGSQWKK